MKAVLPWPGRLRAQLVLLTLLILCPVIALGLYGNLQQRKLEQASVKEKMVALSKLAAANQNRYVEKTRQLLATLAQHPYLVASTDRNHGSIHFSNLKVISPDFVNFGLIEKDGTLFCDANKTNRVSKLDDRAYFQQVMKTGAFAIGSYQEDLLVDEPCLNFAYPVRDLEGTIVRVIFASLKLSLMTEALTEVPLESDGLMMVVDPEGNVLASSDGLEKRVGRKVWSANLLEKIQASSGGTFIETGEDGVEHLYAAMPMSRGSTPGFYAVVGVPKDVSFAHSDAALARNMTVMACITALAFGAALVFGDRLLMRPIKSMVGAAERLSKGDLEARTGVKARVNELSLLAKNFDAMAANLQARETELKQANEEIKQMNAGLEARVKTRTGQLEVLNQELEAFSYSVSHDLRAPLRHISGFAGILLDDGYVKDPESIRFLKSIAASAEQMGTLIDDLLSFSRMSRSEMHIGEVDLARLAGDVMREMIKANPERPIEWHIGELPRVHGDGALLRMVFVNLFSNAIKYSSMRPQSAVEAGYESKENEYVIFVKDNGVGFDMKHASKLFGVFQRLHEEEKFEGTGIGLANVQRIIRRHGGRVWADATVDNGATFYFALPKVTVQSSGNEQKRPPNAT